MYRPEIKVVDCTIRDGGLMNNSQFPTEMVKRVYRSLNESGIDMVELGYKNSKKMFDPKKFGPWRFCDEEDLKRVTDGVEKKVDIAVMQDAHKASADDVAPKEESVIDVIRVATYVKDIDKAIYLANTATEKGYKTTINIMAISHALERELDEALQQVEEETKALACYIVDSFGTLYSEDIHFYVDKYKKIFKTKEVGIHCHNNQQLAFANTIEAIIKEVNYLDGTLYGMGRGAGNCPLEVLVGFLKNPKFSIKPLIEIIGKEIMPITRQIEWGYRIPYMLTGILNLHPQEAIELMDLEDDDPDKFDFIKFYDKLTAEEIY